MLIVTAAAFEELHSTESDTSCAVLSLNVATAVNCLIAPMGIVEFAGVTAIELIVAPVIVTEAVPLDSSGCGRDRCRPSDDAGGNTVYIDC